MRTIISLRSLKPAVASALASCYGELMVQFDGETVQGAEGAFGEALHDALRLAYPNITGERRLSDLGMLQFFADRKDGRVDGYDADTKTALEYKVIRLPRDRHDAFYDIGQLSADYLRLNRSKGLLAAFMVVVMYGPLIEDASSTLSVYRRFHDQMFVERAKCLNEGRFKEGSQDDVASREMTFHTPSEGKPDWVEIVRHRRLAALLYDCR